MSGERKGKGQRLTLYVRPEGSPVAQQEDRIYLPGEERPETEESFREAILPVRPIPNFGDGSGVTGYAKVAGHVRMGEQGPIGMKETVNKPAPKAFTWDDARGIAIIVRDGLLMIVRGFEKYFDIGKK